MGNLKFLNQKDAQNVVPVKETAPQWLYFYKNVKVAVVYGMLELEQKTQEATGVAAKINKSYSPLLFQQT
jgi:hypothetical protein